MANANISEIVLSDTFNTWVQRFNLVTNTVNVLRNSHYYKDGGSLTLNVATTITDNATLTLSRSTGTVLSVAGDAQLSRNLFLGPAGQNVNATLANVANTTRVSANSGSIRAANGINFINTSTVQVSVGADSTGANANVSFTVIAGAGTQGVQGTQGTFVQGTQGVQGRQGAQGVQGLQGLQGMFVQGVQGTQGSAIQGVQGTQGSAIQGVQGLQGAGSPGTQGVQGSSGLTGTQYLYHVTSGYTSSGKVYVSATTPGAGNTQGDIWLQI